MTIETQDIRLIPDDHVVSFYERDSDLALSVGSYLAEGLGAGGVAVVIATAEHREAFELELEAAGIDVPAAAADGRLVALDAAGTVARFTDCGQVDAAGFDEVVGEVVRE